MDECTRYISDDGSLRGAAIIASNTVRSLTQVQTPGANTSLFGELVVGTILTRQMMSPDLRVQATLQRRQGGHLFIDSFADGMTRGLANVPGGAEYELGEEALLQVTRILKNGELQTGTVATEPGKGLSASFTTYMMSSEQTTSLFRLGCVVDDDEEVIAAGGWILQVLPDHDDVFVAAALNLIQETPELDELLVKDEIDARGLFDAVIWPLPFRELVTEEVRFGCNCSHDRMLRAIRTISDEDLAELRGAEEKLEVGCDYCGTIYELDPDEL